MDSRNLIFPMTAGDLVQSAVIVGQPGQLATPTFTQYYEVMGADYSENEEYLDIALRNTVSFEESSVTLHRETIILVTNISRS